MAQLFRPEATRAFRLGLLAVILAVVAVVGAGLAYVRSDWFWNVGATAAQPIPFRHDLHVSGVGVACGFCHSTAARLAHAGMPSAHTCLTCHSQVLQGATVLEPLRTSIALGQPIAWASVHRQPSFVYFHHGAHVSNGVSCDTCHGRVDQMRQTHKVNTLSMGWCLDCHRHPGPQLQAVAPDPGARVDARPDPLARGQPIRDSNAFAAVPLTNCSVCHR